MKVRVPMIHLVAALCTAVGLSQVAQAELAPSTYNDMRADAREVTVIKVIDVSDQITPDNKNRLITIRAEVLYAERSEAGLDTGKMITISWEAPQLSGNDPESLLRLIGPRPIPVLIKGGVYPAFLNKHGDTFKPAARGGSFEMTPTKSNE